MKSMKKGKVFFNATPCGVLTESDDGLFVFSYFSSYLFESNPHAISLTLPLQAEPYNSQTLFPFFDGLIPEGWLLDLATSTFQLNIRDRMGLLLATCRDPIGAVSVEDATDA